MRRLIFCICLMALASVLNAGDGFPAKWFFDNGFSKDDVAVRMWLDKGVALATDGAGRGCAYISLGSTMDGREVKPVIYSPKGKPDVPAGYGMRENDYFQFSVPVSSVPAGTDFDFMVTLDADSGAAPKYWLMEWYDGAEWKSSPRYFAECGSVGYSFCVNYFSYPNHTTFIQSFTLENAVESGYVTVRLKAVGNLNSTGERLAENSASVYLCPATYVACYFTCYKDAEPVRDKCRILQLGNSFTYFYGSAFFLKELCRQGGHQTDVRINVKGSQEFEHHLDVLPMSRELWREGGYDKVLLQDGSYFHAEYGAGSASAIVGVNPKYTPEEIVALTKRMTSEIRRYSPDAEIYLENDWSYSHKKSGDKFLGFGSFEEFDRYGWKGVNLIASADSNVNWIQPVGKAFANARNNYGFSEAYNYLIHTDNYHPNVYGAYLKACVQYLILFGDDFAKVPANGCLPPEEAERLRQAARDIVLGKDRDFHIH